MRKLFKIFGIITFLCFSFFYTDRVMNVISDKDPLKQEIINLSNNYKLSSNEAVVSGDTIIPGSNGREVNIDKSYKKMRTGNVFNDKLLVFNVIYPEYKLKDNMDKYIINGNINKKEVSIVFIINNDNNIDKIISILDNKKVVSNLFIEYNYLFNNINKIKKYNNHNIYSYSDKYTYDTLVIANNIITRTMNNKPIYCLSKTKNKDNINVCSYSNMYTIIPSINGWYNDIKSNLSNGNIILLDTSINTVNELNLIINFINSKGYDIVSLDKLLSENV